MLEREEREESLRRVSARKKESRGEAKVREDRIEKVSDLDLERVTSGIMDKRTKEERAQELAQVIRSLRQCLPEALTLTIAHVAVWVCVCVMSYEIFQSPAEN